MTVTVTITSDSDWFHPKHQSTNDAARFDEAAAGLRRTGRALSIVYDSDAFEETR